MVCVFHSEWMLRLCLMDWVYDTFHSVLLVAAFFGACNISEEIHIVI